jgi:hypothetical protein
MALSDVLASMFGMDNNQPPPSQLAAALAPGGQQATSRHAALAAALAPPGTHYAQLPGPPLLLAGADPSASVPQGAMPIAPQPQSGMAGPQSQPMPPQATPMSPAGQSPMSGGSDMSGGQQPSGGNLNSEQQEIATYRQGLRSQLQALKAQAASATNPEVAKAILDQARGVMDKDQAMEMAFLGTLKGGTKLATSADVPAGVDPSGYQITNGKLEAIPQTPGKTQILSNDQLTQAERDAGGEWTVDTKTGKREQVSGTESDSTRAPNDEESARLVAGGKNPKDYQVNDGKLELIPSAKPDTRSFGVIGEDQFGNKQYGFTDKTTGEVTPYKSPAAVSGVPGADAATANLHGDDFIKTLDPKIAGQVTAIVEGRAPYPTGMLLRTPYGQQLAAMVTQADPTFESGNATARVAARKEFESGGPNSVAGTITSGNAAIKHLGELSDDTTALGNNSIPLWNSVANAYETQTGDKRVTNFNNTVGRFGEEATKFYRGIGGSEADVQRDIANLSPNMSPEQLHGAIQKQANLMRDKIVAYQDRWHKVMGPMVPDFPIVDPSTENVLGKLDKRAGSVATPQGSAPTAPAAAPAPTSDPLAAARDAVAKGAPRAAVIQRLQQNGINPGGL